MDKHPGGTRMPPGVKKHEDPEETSLGFFMFTDKIYIRMGFSPNFF
jgi:hypothetical protein